jgi:hypothetical protein
MGTITIAVWIDDMLACGPDEKELDRVYETKDLGVPAHFLGMEVTRDSNVTKVRKRSKPYEAMLPKSVALIGRLLQQDPIYAMQPQYSRDSHRTLVLSITITACEMVTFRRLLTKWLEGATTIKIKPNSQSTSTLYGDNQGSLAMALNLENRARTRHIEVHHHYVRDKVEEGTIRLDYLNTKDILADMLTKPLQKAEHARFSALLGLRRRQHQQWHLNAQNRLRVRGGVLMSHARHPLESY